MFNFFNLVCITGKATICAKKGGAQRVVVTYFMISAKDMASSTPGMANARSCIIVPIMPFWSAVQTKG